MQLDWTTFLLQIVNFLVLVWLLKRFLYRPVMDVIARRQAAIDDSVEQARATEARARALQADYEARVAELDAAQAARVAQLADELAAERRKRLAALDGELQAERDKRAALAEREAAELRRQVRLAARQDATAFATRLLGRLGDAHLDRRLLDMLVEDLPSLAPAQQASLREAAARADARVEITSAHSLDAAARQALESALADLLGRPLIPHYATDPALAGGLRVGLGAWLLAASLADELSFFREGAHRGE